MDSGASSSDLFHFMSQTPVTSVYSAPCTHRPVLFFPRSNVAQQQQQRPDDEKAKQRWTGVLVKREETKEESAGRGEMTKFHQVLLLQGVSWAHLWQSTSGENRWNEVVNRRNNLLPVRHMILALEDFLRFSSRTLWSVLHGQCSNRFSPTGRRGDQLNKLSTSCTETQLWVFFNR